jgi:hypothetical protein
MATRAATAATFPMPNLAANLFALFRQLWRGLFDPYHPEQHYMRGPGPACQAKHAPASPPVR